MWMSKLLIVGVLARLTITACADEAPTRPFNFYTKGSARIGCKNGTPIYRESAAIIIVPGRVRLCTPEFREIIAVTVPRITAEKRVGGKIFVLHPKIKGLIPLEDLP